MCVVTVIDKGGGVSFKHAPGKLLSFLGSVRGPGGPTRCSPTSGTPSEQKSGKKEESKGQGHCSTEGMDHSSTI